MPRSHAHVVMLSLALLASYACGAKKKEAPEAAPTAPAGPASRTVDATQSLGFAADVQPILAVACSGCHSAGSKWPPQFVGDEAAFRKHGEQILAALRLTDPAKRMPAHREPLSAAQEQTLQTFLASPTGSDRPAPAATTVFAQTVQPILEKNCGACHTPGSSFAPIFVGDEAAFRKNGAAILTAVARTNSPMVMPYAGARPPLTAAEQQILKDFLAK